MNIEIEQAIESLQAETDALHTLMVEGEIMPEVQREAMWAMSRGTHTGDMIQPAMFQYGKGAPKMDAILINGELVSI